jgi:long-chain fatty acid transport protein
MNRPTHRSHRPSRLLSAAAFLLFLPALASAAGFRVSEQSAKATGMANAFTAQADDPSALSYNPGGIAFLKGSQATVGTMTILVPETKFTGTTPASPVTPVHEKAKQDIFLTPLVFATHSLESAPVSIGFAVNSFFPLAKRWDSQGAFRYNIQEIALKPINFQPTVAYRFDAWKLGVAAGFDYVYATVALRKEVPTRPGLIGGGILDIEGSGHGFGYNLGAKWQPLPALSFGAAYRSRVKVDLSGDLNYASTTGSLNRVETDITLPDILSLGVAYRPVEKLTCEFDAERTGWSSYDKLALRFSGDNAAMASLFGTPDRKDWKDVWAYRLGLQYAVTPKVDLRAGWAYDESPAPAGTVGAELPDADRQNYTAGLGYHNDSGALDLSYMYVKFADRTTNTLAAGKQNGTFESDCHIFGVSVTHKF